ncbi:hypothetical protein CRG98_024960 [Punica granatum]|uniref:Uncharacterized protein n=1 Tax=Punica granatum TaxID=22663 RepID=A0A2I0JEJ4_PUNGR|nr:hypothetical protein CRG98_024960 [Punica granatum]
MASLPCSSTILISAPTVTVLPPIPLTAVTLSWREARMQMMRTTITRAATILTKTSTAKKMTRMKGKKRMPNSTGPRKERVSRSLLRLRRPQQQCASVWAASLILTRHRVSPIS